MATKKELTVEEKLRQLYELQLIDNELTELHVLKGELPMEVKDLEDEIEGLETRHARVQRNIDDQQSEIARHRANIEEANNLIVRYKSQLDNVKNNREYEALTKELEMQHLEIQLSEKRIGEAEVIIGTKKETQEETSGRLDQKKVDLERKKVELEKITEDTEKQEKKLIKESETLRKKIEERLLKAYDRVRTNYRNGLAVVPVERNSCGGCFNNVPPQMQLEIGMRKKIIACEHCGRILVDQNILEPMPA
ncbi:MAG: C4-type zinc ribbon domain-containing protein [Bacteroidota bacterium]